MGLEAEVRAINAQPWQPLPGMLKKRCSRCHFWFAVPVTEAEADANHPVRTVPDWAPDRRRPHDQHKRERPAHLPASPLQLQC
jgi:hypothetical protein